MAKNLGINFIGREILGTFVRSKDHSSNQFLFIIRIKNQKSIVIV